MIRSRQLRIAFLVSLGLASGLAGAHNASRGLHLHVEPDPAEPGGSVTVEIDAEGLMRRVRIGFVDQPPLTLAPEEPTSRLEATVPVPDADAGTTVSLQAEAETDDGRTLRASAVVRLDDGDGGTGGPAPSPGDALHRTPRMSGITYGVISME